ncbi:MAG: P-II family nitrogen regulator [Euryarchaeota archaeon]|nr:P-II family nitrogen regulator [Euryarchaeota archaeon]MBV1729683.1 P-II family nitrogen regulator [Methanobacterium sp.]MBU4547479.1 P-II family nitrogen regulator [Euryarchaeota archaeon]MBU4607516.1 P-II family nitrogen regulator [Euryarchaeota archaeon]MBV1754442.1 P-II family nitrogen regulator [Methanobacterium sp.]
MKMIRAIVRPDKAEEIVDSLSEAGHVALTKMDVIGRGKQKGIQMDQICYDELPKVMLLLVTEDEDTGEIIDLITESAFTGNFGDGKIFVSPVNDVFTVRTRTKGL